VPRVFLVILSLAAGIAVGVAAVSLLGSNDEPAAQQETAVTSEAPAETPAPAPDATEGGFLTGFNLTAYTTAGYSGAAVQADLTRLKDLGSTAVVLVPTWYMKKFDSNRIEPDPQKSPDDASLQSAIAAARQLGLEVVLKPHVDVLDGTFRGDIQPSNRPAWFSSYRRFMRHYADIAAGSDVGVFSVGTELKSLSPETESWNAVIEWVRSRFGGELTYAANWDEVFQVQFWDRLDMIGVDAYFPLSQEGEAPTAESLATAWQPNVDGLQSLSEQWGIPVLLTEIGYPSQKGATAHPWEVREGQPADQAVQALAYQAAFDAFEGRSWLRGILWWSWRADPGPQEATKIEYTPEGKQAEGVFSSAATGS
jgi:hypothetical protein